MNVALKPELERFVKDQVNGGRYPTADEVVVAGLELLRQRQAALVDIRAKIAEGIQQAHRGELLDGELVLRDIFGMLDKDDNR